MSAHLVAETIIDVYELCKNGESLFADIVSDVEDDVVLFSHLARGIRIVEGSANLIRFPKSKCREIEGHSLKCKVYEAKSGPIRTYLFH